MKRSFMIVVVAAFALVSGLAINRSSAEPKEPSAPTRVAVVDIGRLFRNYEKAQKFAADQDKAMKALEEEDKTRKDAIDTLNDKMSGPTGLRPGTPEYDKATEQITTLMIERQAWRNTKTEMYNRTNMRLNKEIHEEIVKTTGLVAQELGYTLVLARESAELSTRTVDEFLDQLTRRKVIYADNSLDITAKVLEKLNETYRGQKK